MPITTTEERLNEEWGKTKDYDGKVKDATTALNALLKHRSHQVAEIARQIQPIFVLAEASHKNYFYLLEDVKKFNNMHKAIIDENERIKKKADDLVLQLYSCQKIIENLNALIQSSLRNGTK